MFSIFRKQAQAPKPTRPTSGYVPGRTLDYFRDRDDLRLYVRGLFNQVEFKEMLAVLHHELPLHSTIEAVVAHKRVIRMIELMAEKPEASSDPVETTFSPEQEISNTNQPTDTEE